MAKAEAAADVTPLSAANAAPALAAGLPLGEVLTLDMERTLITEAAALNARRAQAEKQIAEQYRTNVDEAESSWTLARATVAQHHATDVQVTRLSYVESRQQIESDYTSRFQPLQAEYVAAHEKVRSDFAKAKHYAKRKLK